MNASGDTRGWGLKTLSGASIQQTSEQSTDSALLIHIPGLYNTSVSSSHVPPMRGGGSLLIAITG